MSYVETVTSLTSSQPSSPAHRSLRIAEITEATHHEFLATAQHASFLQNPRWPNVKTDWRGQSLGWFDGDELVAASLVLYRSLPVPGMKKRTLAYLAEGPTFDQEALSLDSVLKPLVPYLKAQGAFLARMGLPTVQRRWAAADVRKGLSGDDAALMKDLEPLETSDTATAMGETLRKAGWQEPSAGEDFAAGQPQFQARIPLPHLENPDEEDEEFQQAVDQVLSRMDSTSRRQTRKSTRSDLEITVGTEKDLPAWHELYEETANRDDFSGRPLSYFQRMYAELNDSPTANCQVLLAHFEGKLLAAAIYVQQRDTGWYVYGASSSEERKRYAPRALQLEQIKLALKSGCSWYDLGGVSATLNREHELAGLTRFKSTMGADVIETLGEWDYPISPMLTKAFNLYMARR